MKRICHLLGHKMERAFIPFINHSTDPVIYQDECRRGDLTGEWVVVDKETYFALAHPTPKL